MNIDLSNLLTKAEELSYDEQVGFAACIEYPVEKIVVDDVTYKLSLKLEID